MNRPHREDEQPRDENGRFLPIPEADEYSAPSTVPCPCGAGEATLRRQTTIETTRTVRGSRVSGGREGVHYHYRHEGCSIGGTIVALDGSVHRRIGPLFDPGRYGTRMATDGGES